MSSRRDSVVWWLLASSLWGVGCASRMTSTEALGRGYLAECRGDWPSAAAAFRQVAERGGTLDAVTAEERLAALEGLSRASVALGRPGEALRALGTLPGAVTTTADCRLMVLAAKLVAAAGQAQDADRMVTDVAGALRGLPEVSPRLRTEVFRWAGEAGLRQRQFETAERWLSLAVEAARTSGDAESLRRCQELRRLARTQTQTMQKR
ncbi:MAG: hypothetical protein ACI4WT_09080 [Oligosphaeraceae bacterium]